MLTALHIENIAIIDRLDLEFQTGFTVLTGETGAGKSIIIDSIMLLLGNKASRELIRSGADGGIVNATFCLLSNEALEILKQNDLFPDEDGNISIYRKIGMDGRNVARINGINVTVSMLKELGEHLISIHGQHDGVLLLDSKRHLAYLDEFGSIDKERSLYQNSYQKVKEIRNLLTVHQQKELQKDQRKKQLIEWIDQLEECSLREGEHDELLIRRKNLMENTEILDGLHTAVDAIYDGEIPAAQQVHDALNAVLPLEALLPQGKEIIQRLTQISADLDDLGAELGKYFDSYASEQMDPKEIEERLDQLEEIKKSFGPTDQDVLKNHKDYCSELELLNDSGNQLKILEERFIEAKNELENRASALTTKRVTAAKKMESALKDELRYLDMPKIRFYVHIRDRLNERGGLRYRPDGKDDVEFFLSANAGEDLRPLSKIASGGELSRIMLSMKSVLNQGFDSVIYDEVDTGVSGATAEKIGKKLKAGTENRQVFCITHLAQIAACADHHFKVSKSEQKGRVSSCVQELSREERISEIARIMGGEVLSETLLRSAEEILSKTENKD